MSHVKKYIFPSSLMEWSMKLSYWVEVLQEQYLKEAGSVWGLSYVAPFFYSFILELEPGRKSCSGHLGIRRETKVL